MADKMVKGHKVKRFVKVVKTENPMMMDLLLAVINDDFKYPHQAQGDRRKHYLVVTSAGRVTSVEPDQVEPVPSSFIVFNQKTETFGYLWGNE